MTIARVLIVDDDKELLRLLQIDLRRNGYEVVTANNGVDGLRVFQDTHPDLIVLDVSLPGMDGMTVCQRIRETSDAPILMMTAHAVNEEEIAHGLNIGADEFMLKPLRNIEFHARVRALLRRAKIVQAVTHSGAPRTISYKDDYLEINLKTRRVCVDGDEVRLTPTEFKLLSMFVEHIGEVLTFEQLLENVWGYEYKREHHYPRIYVSHLRRKLEVDASNPHYIRNEYGVGYRFVGQNEQDSDPSNEI